jgi:solute carrier family 25 protein 34/35
MLLNGSRLGFYEPIRKTVNSVLGFTPTDQIAYTSVMAGAASGVVGGEKSPCFAGG